MLATELS